MRELLLQDTQELFESELKKKKEGYEFNPAWSSEFSKYLDKNIMPDIENLAKYSIKENCGTFFNDFTGVTTNQAEGLNKRNFPFFINPY